MNGSIIPSPVGDLWFGIDGAERPISGWSRLDPPPGDLRTPPPGWRLRERLRRVILGEGDDFADLPLPSGTPFQQAVWDELRRIPRGTVATYGDLALRVGCHRGARAVGQAMRRNPAPVLLPCHRVVGAASPGGYAGQSAPWTTGGRIKEFLLRVERSGPPTLATPPHPAASSNR